MLVSWASIHGNLTHAGQSIQHCKTVKVTVLKSMVGDNGGMSAQAPNTLESSSQREIFVGDFKEVWDRNEVLASEIMQEAGVTTIDGFILEALDHKNGKAVQDFN